MTTATASALIDQRIAELGDWRGARLGELRTLIREAVPGVVEEWKWMGTPVWSCDGILCTGESYKDKLKLTFAKGASLPDPAGLFNASLDGNMRRAIDIHEGAVLDGAAFKALIAAAAAFNAAAVRAKAGKAPAAATRRPAPASAAPRLLAGGNPQIAKADGDAPVQAYIAAMPGWKSEVGRRLDALVVQAAPEVRKAIKWNSPFYGIEGRGWFLSFHTFTNYVKVTFFLGSALQPVPPGGTAKDARWIDVREDGLDEAQMTDWIRQAVALPGWGKS